MIRSESIARQTTEIRALPETLRSNWYWSAIYRPDDERNANQVIIADIEHFERPFGQLPEGAIGFRVFQQVEQDYLDQDGQRRTMHDIRLLPGKRIVGGELLSQADLVGRKEADCDEIASLMQMCDVSWVVKHPTGHVLVFDPENDVLLEKIGG